MISYKPLLKLLIDKGVKKSDLPMSPATIAKLNKNEYVALEVIDKLCEHLNCQPGDIIEYVPD